MKKRIVTLIALLMAGAAFAASWSGSFRFSPSSVGVTAVVRDGETYQLVQPVKGRSQPGLAALTCAEPGKPALPQWVFTLVIPQGMRVAGVDCEPRGSREISRGVRVFPGQPPIPFTKTALPPFVAPDPAVYESDAAWPGSLAAASTVGIKSGFRLVTITLNPVQYRPATGLLEVAGELDVTVRYERDPQARPELLTREQLASFGSSVRALVYNRADVDRFAPSVRATDFGTIDCVIITTGTLESYFQPLAAWRTKKGFKTETRLVSWITSNYSGRDTPEKIRNFIIDYYTNEGIRYVLLGGDNAEVPCRQARAYVNSEVGNIPTDLYYGDLQGTWDDDLDNIFGEEAGDIIDLYADVYVGRASVDNTTQVQTFVNKVLTHEKNPPTAYLRRMLMADAFLWSGYDHTQSNDSIAAITPSGWTDVIIHDPGSSTAIRDSINNGFQFCHFIGHGNETGIYDGGDAYYSTGYANSQTNGDKVNLMNANSCYTGNFEYSDCVAEAAHNRNGGGSIGVIFNSRFGWGYSSQIGPSELLDIRFYDFFFNHDTMPIGITHALSKEVYRGTAISQQVWRWCYYEMNLLGDPLLMMYESVPTALSAAFASPIGVGNQSFTVTVTSGGSPVQNSLVCLQKGSEVYARNYTNGSGQVTFSITPATMGYMGVTATKANYLPDEDSCEVVSGLPRDVGPMRIVAPTGTVDSGASVTPRAMVRNYGTLTATFPVTLKIGSFYNNTQNVTNLAGGDSLLVTFTGWTANQRGSHAVRCSTGLTSDQTPSNDTLAGSVTVRVVNAGVTAIVSPSGAVDSGSVNTVRARVKNFGTAAASFPVTFRIGAIYSDVQNVTSLNPGDSTTVTFTNWTPTQRGTFSTKCTSALAGDQVPANNYQTGSVTVGVLDAAVMSILGPTGTVDSGTAVMPRAKVQNRGSAAASFTVTFKIGAFYTNTQSVTNLNPGDSLTVTFNNWTANQRGTHATRCTTSLTGDKVRQNDTLSGSVTMRVTNVGVTAILSPTGTRDSGTVIVPQARVKNYGSQAASFPVRFRIGTFYADTQNVTGLNPGDSIVVSFKNWTAIQRGTHTTRCTTALTGDQVAGNNAMNGQVTIRNPGDVGVTAIVAPAGNVDSGTLVVPQVWVTNFGGTPATFPVTFRIGILYADVQTVTALSPGDSTLVSFVAWNANRRGVWATACTTTLAGDTVTSNDGGAGSVTVRVVDVASYSIQSPAGTYEPGRAAAPVATWRNLGTQAATFKVYAKLQDASGSVVYAESSSVANLDPGQTIQITAFPSCTLKTLGGWQVRCSTALAGDVAGHNDVLAKGFSVAAMWREVKSMPRTPTNTDVKEGAWLSYMSADGIIYAAKGHSTADFYSYSPEGNNWAVLPSVPYGVEAKPLRKGSCGVADGSRYVYVAKGNNTLGFYRYDITDTSWSQLTDVPAGNGTVRGGAGIVYVRTGDTGYVYLLKGYTTDFVRFNTVNSQWDSRAFAPTGAKPKWDKGSWLAYDGAYTIYAHKSKLHELWAYDIITNTWSGPLSPMPYVSQTGRSKKSKDGSCAAWNGGSIFALKGGNTNEFWEYRAQFDAWAERDTMPSFGSTNKRKRVNAGGALTIAEGAAFALKGNKTLELWRYVVGAAAAPVPDMREGVMSRPVQAGRQELLRLEPNPAAGPVTIRYNLPVGTTGNVTVTDAAGRIVLERPAADRSGTVSLRLPAGVYLVKLTSQDYSATQKLVVQH